MTHNDAGMTAERTAPPADTSDDGGDPTLLYLLGRIDRVIRQAIGNVVKAQGLSVNQYTTLSVLDRRSGLSNAQLSRRALVSPQSMNEVLLALEQRGLVRRRAHPDHARVLQTRLTTKGRSLLASCDAEVQQVEARMVSCLSDEDRAGLRAALLHCIRSLLSGRDKEEGTSGGSRIAGTARQGAGDAGGPGGGRPG
jgi:DNA-binding MarR family transcriptional regulator